MSTQPPASLDALIENATEAMETDLSTAPETSAPEPAAPPPPAAPVPEPPAPPVQAQTPPTPTVAQAEQATPAAPAADPFEAIRAELAETKAALAALKTPPTPAAPETPAEPPPTPQELVELDTIINGYSQSYWKADNEFKQADAQRTVWQTHLNGLNKRLVRSFNDPAVDTAKLVSDIQDAEQALAQYDHYLETTAQRRADHLQQFKVQTSLRDQMERVLKLTEAHERATQAESDRQITSEASNWRTAKWEPAKKAASEKVPENLRARFDAYVERLGKAHVNSRGPDGKFTNSITDPAAFVNSAAEDFLAVARDGAQSYTAQKVAEIPASPANGKASTPAPPGTKPPQTEAELDAYLERQWDAVSL